MSNNICSICKTRTASFDCESNSYFSTCSACFNVTSSKPYCYNRECSQQVCGTQTELVNAGPAVTVENALYACPRGCGKPATRIGWAIGAGRHSATVDAHAKLEGGEDAWRVDIRLVHIGKNYDAEHAVSRAYARSYVDTAKRVLGV